VLSGRILCDGPITLPEDSTECGVSEYDRVLQALIAVPSSHGVLTEALRCKRSSTIINSVQNWRLL